MYILENLFAIEYTPFSPAPKINVIIVLSNTFIIHHDKLLGINGVEYFKSFFKYSFVNS